LRAADDAHVVAFGLVLLFVLGALVGVLIGIPIFFVSLVRGARAVHADGVVCRAELIAKDDVVGPGLAGPALVRLSGAFEAQASSSHDVLGFDVRMQKTSTTDAHVGDQDVLFGSFESFHTAAHDKAATNIGDYFNNKYSTVTPWLVHGGGAAILRLTPTQSLPADRATTRLARLDADIAADQARMTLNVERGGVSTHIAELRLLERLPTDARALRASMFRQGRKLRPVGFRNGIRATVYPLSQLARRLRGG
jgi:hypothetical protein